jgi:branched-chain amino acid transport system substrate-binding protein
MIRLAYEDDVLVVVSGLDSSSNIGQQIAAKAFLPVVAPVAADSTLSQARVPWIFQLPPTDDSQARILVEACLRLTAARRIGLISAASHDSRIQADSLRRAMHGFKLVPHFDFPLEQQDRAEVSYRVKQNTPDSLVLAMPADAVLDLLKALAAAGVTCPIGLPWVPGLDTLQVHSLYPGAIVLIEPFTIQSDNQRYLRFRDAYHARFGQDPSYTAIYGYEAVQMIVTGLSQAGLSRKGLRQALAGLSPYQGVSGKVQWDHGGANCAAQPVAHYLTHPRLGAR